MNAKREFEYFVEQVQEQVLCATITIVVNNTDIEADLPLRYTPEELEKFLDKIDVEYENESGNDAPRIYGNIWFEHSWAGRYVDETGWECWEHYKKPDIPEYLRK